jgi:hypothetical protein
VSVVCGAIGKKLNQAAINNRRLRRQLLINRLQLNVRIHKDQSNFPSVARSTNVHVILWYFIITGIRKTRPDERLDTVLPLLLRFSNWNAMRINSFSSSTRIPCGYIPLITFTYFFPISTCRFLRLHVILCTCITFAVPKRLSVCLYPFLCPYLIPFI